MHGATVLQASASGSRANERNERKELLVGGFPELGVTLGVPHVIRILIYWGLYGGSLFM